MIQQANLIKVAVINNKHLKQIEVVYNPHRDSQLRNELLRGDAVIRYWLSPVVLNLAKLGNNKVLLIEGPKPGHLRLVAINIRDNELWEKSKEFQQLFV